MTAVRKSGRFEGELKKITGASVSWGTFSMMFDSLPPSGGLGAWSCGGGGGISLKARCASHLTGAVEAAAQEVTSDLWSLAHQRLVVGREGFCKKIRTRSDEVPLSLVFNVFHYFFSNSCISSFIYFVFETIYF